MSEIYNDIKIDKSKLNRMRFKIYSLETRNVKTRKYRHRDMVENIYKIMIEEMQKTM